MQIITYLLVHLRSHFIGSIQTDGEMRMSSIPIPSPMYF